MAAKGKRSGLHFRDLLLLIPILALMVPSWFARREPVLLGFPFFYWYQFAWVLGGAGLTGIVFWLRRRGEG